LYHLNCAETAKMPKKCKNTAIIKNTENTATDKKDGTSVFS